MCGIVCIYNQRIRINKNVLYKVTKSLKHRGPCSDGIKIELKGKLGLGNTRLALVDLHERSDQPLEIDNFVITFNGEIYNHKELRRELERFGFTFLTLSDTEVIVKSFQKWGLSSFNKFNGCFAFALYDKKSGKLYVVRDPIGKKQIVYSKAMNGDWVFASEVKAVLKHPWIKAEPNIDRFLSDLIFKFFSDKKETHFKGVYYIPAGHYFVFDLEKESEPRIKKYWDIDECRIRNYSNRGIKSIIDDFTNLLYDSVKLKMDADTEIGSILSGGIDSSLITRIAYDYHVQKYNSPFNCFTIRYDYGFNRDLQNAKLLCSKMKNAKLNEVKVDEDIKINDLDAITFSLEEPLLDKVFISQFMNYKAVKEHGLRAVINGQGADELWLGYYFFYDLFRLPSAEINKKGLKKYWLKHFRFRKFIKSRDVIRKVNSIVADNLEKNFLHYKEYDRIESLVNFSIKTHLQSMFIQEDRLSMANSIEVRLPHVDLRLVKLALSVPSRMKILDKREKYVPRTAAKRENILPSKIYTRRKLAFPDPPNRYDRKAESIFNKKEIVKSKIVSEIFKGNTDKFFYDLSIRDRWILLAISRMEKVFFD